MNVAPGKRSIDRWWLIGIGLGLLLIQAALILLWWKLPAWAPRWTAEHAPTPELALRAMRYDPDEVFPLLEVRIFAWGSTVGPALRRQFLIGDHQHRLQLLALGTGVAGLTGDGKFDVPGEVRQIPDYSEAEMRALHEDLVELALAAVADGSSYLPSNASYLASRLEDPRIVPAFCVFLITQKPPIAEDVESVVRMLGDKRDARAVPALIPLLPIRHKAHPEVEDALAQCLDDTSAPHVLAAMRHEHEVIRAWAARQFPRYRTSPEMVAQLTAMLADPERTVCLAAISAVTKTRLASASDALLRLAQQPGDPDTRVAAVEALGVLAYAPAATWLRSLTMIADDPLRPAAIIALERISQ